MLESLEEICTYLSKIFDSNDEFIPFDLFIFIVLSLDRWEMV